MQRSHPVKNVMTQTRSSSLAESVPIETAWSSDSDSSDEEERENCQGPHRKNSHRAHRGIAPSCHVPLNTNTATQLSDALLKVRVLKTELRGIWKKGSQVHALVFGCGWHRPARFLALLGPFWTVSRPESTMCECRSAQSAAAANVRGVGVGGWLALLG